MDSSRLSAADWGVNVCRSVDQGEDFLLLPDTLWPANVLLQTVDTRLNLDSKVWGKENFLLSWSENWPMAFLISNLQALLSFPYS